MATSPHPKHSHCFTYPAYLLQDCQSHLIDLFKSLIPKEMRPRFFDNKGYLGGIITLLDSFTPHALDQNDQKIFKDFISLLQSIETAHEETGEIPTDTTWQNLLKVANAFLKVSLSLTPSEFFLATQNTIKLIEGLVKEDNKIHHLKALGLANCLKWTGYFDDHSSFSTHLTSLCKALDNFAPNPCPSFDAILKKPVIEELKTLQEILMHISV